MLTQDSARSPDVRTPAVAVAAPAGGDRKIALSPMTMASVVTIAGAAAGALAMTWVLFERVLPFSGVLAFGLCWFAVFLALYAALVRVQWDGREVSDRVTTVGMGTVGVCVLLVVLGMVVYLFFGGLPAIRHPNFFTQTMAVTNSQDPLTSGGCLHAIVGTVEQIAMATVFSVPLALLTGIFLAEIGGPLTRVVRVIVEAMTALPDIIAGLFIYVLLLLDLGMHFSGFAAALALTVNMMPIIARASEVIIRLVPGTLREAAYALGGSQWRTAWKVTLPTARSGLATAVVLGMARGIGETAPVLLVAGTANGMNANPFSGQQIDLPLYIWVFAHTVATTPQFIDRGIGAGFALVLVVLVLFAIARRLGGSAPGELTRRQRRRIARSAVAV